MFIWGNLNLFYGVLCVTCLVVTDLLFSLSLFQSFYLFQQVQTYSFSSINALLFSAVILKPHFLETS